MVKKAQMPVKNIVILTALIVIIFLIVGGVVWYFVGETLFQEKELSLPENATTLELITLEIEKLVDEEAKFISEETGYSYGESKSMVLAIEYQRSNYPDLDVNDSYELAYMDFLDYQEHIDEDVSLPEAYLETVSSPSNQIGIAPDLKSGVSFNELLENITNQTVDEETFGDFDIMDLVTDSVYESLNTTSSEFGKSLCVLGFNKIISLRADNLISENNEVNYVFDQLIYGPDGKIITNLSIPKKGNYSFLDYIENEFVFIDFVQIPLEYEPGTYVVEYFVYDFTKDITSIVKVPLKCNRQLFIDNINFVSFDDVGIFIRENNTFNAGELMSLRYWLGGFEGDLNNQPNQVQLEWNFYDSDYNLIKTINNLDRGGLTMNKDEYLYNLDFIVLPEDFVSGDYFLELNINDLLYGDEASTLIGLKVK
jgi:hypothetical protein